MTDRRGLFDIHIHGIADSDTSAGSAEEILKIARYQKLHGVDRIILSMYPDSLQHMRKNMEAIRDAMQIIKREKIQDAADIVGMHLEGPFLNPKMAGALRRESFLPPSGDSLRRLTEGFEGTIRLITIAPELEGAGRIIRACRDSGIRVSMGHSDATYAEALAGKNAGATGITHLFNAMRPFHHREPGIAGFGLLDDDIFVEVIADGVHLDLNTMRLIFAMKPAGKVILVSDGVKGARQEDTAVYSESGLLAGSGVTLKQETEFLMKHGFDPETVTMAATANPDAFLRAA